MKQSLTHKEEQESEENKTKLREKEWSRNRGRKREQRTGREMERENGSFTSLDPFHVSSSSSPQRESKMK